MYGELEHLLRTHCDNQAAGEQGALCDIMAGLRGLADELQLDFERALAGSQAMHEDQLMLAFDPRI
jgi:hypothetical protein